MPASSFPAFYKVAEHDFTMGGLDIDTRTFGLPAYTQCSLQFCNQRRIVDFDADQRNCTTCLLTQ
jgi:hypothetical protein